MPEIDFAGKDTCVFPTKHHGEVTLSKTKWSIICGAPERYYYRYNGEKVATTLINPDLVRYHAHEKNQFFYYKKFTKIYTDTGIEIPVGSGIFFAVIIDTGTGRICTVYPVREPKIGKTFAPAKA